jgi:hypothetical protein
MQTIEFSSSSSSPSDTEEERRQRIRKCATLVVASVAEAIDTPVVRMRGGSRPGKAKNRDNGVAQRAIQIDRDYFNRVCVLPAPIAGADVERIFRMPRSVYELLREGLLETDEYFLQKQDAVGQLGAFTDQKMFCALRQLAYGVPADAVCKYVLLLESTDSESLHRHFFVRRFESGSRRNGFEGLTRMTLFLLSSTMRPKDFPVA